MTGILRSTVLTVVTIIALMASFSLKAQTLTGFWVFTSQSRTLTTNSDDFWVCSNDSVIIEGNWGTYYTNGDAYWLPIGTSYSYNSSYEKYIPPGFIFMCANADGSSVASYNKTEDTIAAYFSSTYLYFYKVIDTSIGGITISIDTLNHRYIKNTINVPRDSSQTGYVPAFIYVDYDTISPDTVSIKNTSPIFYHDTTITIDTSVTSRDTIGINIVTNKQILTTITYWQYYFTTTIDSIFTISSSKVLDTTFTFMDTTSARKQTTTNRSIVDTTILLPRMIIRDTVFAMDTLERTDDTVVHGKDTTIFITHSLVLLILRRDTLPDTAVTMILRDTLVHSGDTTIHIIDTSVIPFVLRDTIIQSDSITYTLRDTTIIGTDTIIRIHDTTVLALSSVSVFPGIASGKFSYFGNGFEFTSSDQSRELKIYDMLGRCLFSMQIMPGQISQSLPYLQSGAYIASLGNQVLKFIRTQ